MIPPADIDFLQRSNAANMYCRQVCADGSGSLLQWRMSVEAVSLAFLLSLYLPGDIIPK